MTAFFIPGIAPEPGIVEHTYSEMCGVIELELGRRPNGRRIAKLWTRRGGTDCMMEVGMPDPLRGGTVMAIFDMGQHRPYVVWWRVDGDIAKSGREVLGHSVYSVVEFDS